MSDLLIATNYVKDVKWTTTKSKNGVKLQCWGEGNPLVVIPGLEGSGESCLHLVMPAILELQAKGIYRQVCLVDYAQENHSTLNQLIETIYCSLTEEFDKEDILLFSQSFGNLLSSKIAVTNKLHITKMFLSSPFTKLPDLMVNLANFSMNFTPTFLYRATIAPMGRYVFGPTGEKDHPFFNSLKGATSNQVKRQVGWLKGLDYADVYPQISVPAKILLGRKDRLVNIKQQINYFEALCSRQNNKTLVIENDSGHVITQKNAAFRTQQQLEDFFI